MQANWTDDRNCHLSYSISQCDDKILQMVKRKEADFLVDSSGGPKHTELHLVRTLCGVVGGQRPSQGETQEVYVPQVSVCLLLKPPIPSRGSHANPND